jgi:hypothetical protein
LDHPLRRELDLEPERIVIVDDVLKSAAKCAGIDRTMDVEVAPDVIERAVGVKKLVEPDLFLGRRELKDGRSERHGNVIPRKVDDLRRA